jgi:hypothetical protein|tara:strand:+ start:1578 stop:1766 length:189 start_codon:yes stop_codon:yes gene_type:complete
VKIIDKRVLVSKEEHDKRLDICNNCEYKKTDRWTGVDYCSECGCFLKLKIQAQAWHCPLKKW